MKMWGKFQALKRWQKFVLVLLLLSLIGAFTGGSDSTSSQSTSSAAMPEESQVETEAPAVEALTPQEQLTAALIDKLGENTNRDLPTLRNVVVDDTGVIIEVNGNDNLTENMVKDSARSQLKDIIEVVQNSGLNPKELRAVVWFTFVNNLGEEQDRPAVAYGISGKVLQRIQTENILFEDLDAAPDLYADVHPAFMY